jgi:hypothetical protein
MQGSSGFGRRGIQGWGESETLPRSRVVTNGLILSLNVVAKKYKAPGTLC